jgi:hypothetical protein
LRYKKEKENDRSSDPNDIPDELILDEDEKKEKDKFALDDDQDIYMKAFSQINEELEKSYADFIEEQRKNDDDYKKWVEEYEKDLKAWEDKNKSKKKTMNN